MVDAIIIEFAPKSQVEPCLRSTWNYDYDPIGNLVQDVNDSIDLISWTVTGKVSDVIFASSKDDLTFRYDPMGNRIAKIQKPKNWTDEEEWTITWYARDAQGNVLAVYNKPENSTAFSATEFNIYGSSRIGMVTQPEELDESPPDPVAHSQTLGYKVYEFSNHLGNVLTTFSDRKIPTEGDPGLVAYYSAEILSSTDYYPFGFEMPGRSYTGSGYRYGYQGIEIDDEIKGSGNSYTTFYRQLDPRIGRWFSIDPKANSSESTYTSMGNNPIRYIDILGDTLRVRKDDQPIFMDDLAKTFGEGVGFFLEFDDNNNLQWTDIGKKMLYFFTEVENNDKSTVFEGINRLITSQELTVVYYEDNATTTLRNPETGSYYYGPDHKAIIQNLKQLGGGATVTKWDVEFLFKSRYNKQVTQNSIFIWTASTSNDCGDKRGNTLFHELGHALYQRNSEQQKVIEFDNAARSLSGDDLRPIDQAHSNTPDPPDSR